jgi:hypothetical protein
MKCGRMRRNKREVTVGTAHTVTVSSLIESNKQTNKQICMSVQRSFLNSTVLQCNDLEEDKNEKIMFEISEAHFRQSQPYASDKPP